MVRFKYSSIAEIQGVHNYSPKLDRCERVECQSPRRSLFIILDCLFFYFILLIIIEEKLFLFSLIIILFTENKDFVKNER